MRLLEAHEIDVRVGTISKKSPKAMLLLYKDARCDMAVLDKTFGSNLWQSRYERISDVLFCSIGVYNEKIKEWVWKTSNGVESQGTGDDDPNNKKGEASDSFKRSGFMWGIGRELYEWKDLWIDYDKEKDKYERYSVSKIAYDDNGKPKDIVIVNSKNKPVYILENGYFKKITDKASNNTQKEEKVDTSENNVADTDFVDVEVIEKEVREEKTKIYMELIKIAADVYQEEGFTENILNLAKQSTLEYFVNELKIPIEKVELAKNIRKTKITGNVFVLVDNDFIENFKISVKSNTDIPF